MSAVTAILLAGGLGTRLRPVVRDLPKPLAPVANRPFITYLIDNLIAQRFDDIVISVGYRYEAFAELLGSVYRGVRIRYVIEDTPLGTGGAIRHALTSIHAKTALVLNADTFLDVDFQKFFAGYSLSGSKVGMTVRKVDDTSRYGRCEINNGHVVGFGEKGFEGPGCINAGVYLIDRDLFRDFEPLDTRFSFENDFLARFVETLKPTAFECNGYFIDIGIPEDFTRANVEFSGSDFLRRTR